ncbi:MAG: sugar phosphate isomerase/epimerase, partial [Natronospirillum sp.]
MKTIKGPALFLAQYVSDEAPFNSLDSIAAWAAGLGFRGVQVPTWDKRLFDLERAATDLDYCQSIHDCLAAHGVALTELSTHLQGQLVAVHPVYDEMYDGFAPE